MAVDKLSPRRFEQVLEEATQNPDAPQARCRTWVQENPDMPNPWVDWSSDPYDSEPHEGKTPTLLRARMLCEGCPLEDLCTAASLAKPPYHGVRGSGLRYELGRRLR